MRRIALSIKQPWATLIVFGLKRVELRRWSTRRRGRILIHTGQVPDRREEGWRLLPKALRSFADQRGGLVGQAELVECRAYPSEDEFASDEHLHRVPADWFRGPRMFGFEFANAEPIPFEPCKGGLYFFAYPDGEGVEPGTS